MIIAAFAAFLIAIGVLFMMRDEITSGFYRWQDHLLTTPLLLGSAVVILWLDTMLPSGTGIWQYGLLVLRAFMAFGLMVVVWGGTLTAGTLLLRLLFHRSR